MSLPDALRARLSLPVIGAPMFLVSTPPLVRAQCRAGIIGAFPSLNARTPDILDAWLAELGQTLGGRDAPFAVNLIVHRTNPRLEVDLALCVRHRVPIVITSLGAQPHVYQQVAAYGGLVFHDVTTPSYARKALDKGAPGLVAVAAGAGGHAGTLSPFALIQEIRAMFGGPLALSGAIATGGSILAAQAIGADLAYVGSAFIASEEAEASADYKVMVAASHAEDILYTSRFTGVPGNYLRPSIVAAGIDPATLSASDEVRLDMTSLGHDKKAWRDIWGCGQGIGAVDAVLPAADLVCRWRSEYASAKAALT